MKVLKYNRLNKLSNGSPFCRMDYLPFRSHNNEVPYSRYRTGDGQSAKELQCATLNLLDLKTRFQRNFELSFLLVLL